jgi:hypothetical protein
MTLLLTLCKFIFGWVPEAFNLGVKRPGREADHSPQPSAEVKNAWKCTSTPPISLHGMMLSQSTGKNLPLPGFNISAFKMSLFLLGSNKLYPALLLMNFIASVFSFLYPLFQ